MTGKAKLPKSKKSSKQKQAKDQSIPQIILRHLLQYGNVLLRHIRLYAELLISVVIAYLTAETVIIIHDAFVRISQWFSSL
jgi:hypothetical protein